MTDNPFRPRAIKLMRDVATRPRSKPVKLATGETTNVYLDVKGVLTNRFSINLAADAMINHIGRFKANAIGGPTMGADVISHVVVSRLWMSDAGLQWFSVREPKLTHGLGRTIEGYALGEGDKVILTDDVASSGKSLVEAYEEVLIAGADVLAVAPFVDRAGVAEGRLKELGYDAPFVPLMTWEDLGLAPLARKEAVSA